MASNQPPDWQKVNCLGVGEAAHNREEVRVYYAHSLEKEGEEPSEIVAEPMAVAAVEGSGAEVPLVAEGVRTVEEARRLGVGGHTGDHIAGIERKAAGEGKIGLDGMQTASEP